MSVKISKTARASGATGKVKSRGPQRSNQKYKVGHRARKGPRCAACGRRRKVGEECQFQGSHGLVEVGFHWWSKPCVA